MEIAERRLVKCRCLYDALGSELVNHHFNKADLLSCEAVVIEKLAKGCLSSDAIHTHQAANKVGQGGGTATGE